MEKSRRNFVKLAGGAIGSAAVLGSASTASAQESVADVYRSADPSNYTDANRTSSDVRWIVIHTIEGSYEDGYTWFENPDANVSSHFVIGNEPGQIMQMVDIEDIAWTNGGDGSYNDTGVNFELEGYANSTDFNDNIYEQTAEAVAHICEKYGVPKRHPTFDLAPCDPYDGEGGVIGHNQIPNADCTGVTDGKVDPGDTFDWNYLMDLVDGEVDDGDGGDDGDDGGNGGTAGWPTYSSGDENRDVYTVQYLLEANGYPMEYHDGIYGNEVETTVESFQSDTGLTVDGVVGPNTWDELVVTASDGDENQAVRAAQDNLRYKHGYDIAVDGGFGPGTEDAVESFQSASGILVDGIVGPQTWEYLVG
ncbi:N-acetylmuramoyl-L-alanine amidase [Halorussus salilacus]|uniref:peptidoglycan recognition protein family protein n=1 Tax=Halorussus salilacus TaxID=2953750 RepID=UPI00209FD026|nr:N-acetylmuramoyl-L-alanine amidase [Halorussus salilacus]USZ67565.1 N-acetylmuramoyl-L-alanine amidase [Halorussus salilacus]